MEYSSRNYNGQVLTLEADFDEEIHGPKGFSTWNTLLYPSYRPGLRCCLNNDHMGESFSSAYMRAVVFSISACGRSVSNYLARAVWPGETSNIGSGMTRETKIKLITNINREEPGNNLARDGKVMMYKVLESPPTTYYALRYSKGNDRVVVRSL